MIHGPEIAHFDFPQAQKAKHPALLYQLYQYEGRVVELKSCWDSIIKNKVSPYHSSKRFLWSLIFIQFPCERTLW